MSMGNRNYDPSDLELWTTKHKRTIHNYIEVTIFLALVAALLYFIGELHVN